MLIQSSLETKDGMLHEGEHEGKHFFTAAQLFALRRQCQKHGDA